MNFTVVGLTLRIFCCSNVYEKVTLFQLHCLVHRGKKRNVYKVSVWKLLLLHEWDGIIIWHCIFEKFIVVMAERSACDFFSVLPTGYFYPYGYWIFCVIVSSLTLCVSGIYLIVACVMKNHLSLSEIKILVFKRVYLILASRNSLNYSNNGLWYFLCLRQSVLDSHAQKSLPCRRAEALSLGICGVSRPNWFTSLVHWRIFQFAVKTRRRDCEYVFNVWRL
jgi:hypothetical protein